MINAIGACVALAIAVILPVGYLAIGYLAEVDRLCLIAELNASRVSRYIYQHESMWQFHRVRLAELVQLRIRDTSPIGQRIFAEQGGMVIEEGVVDAPSISRSAPIIENGTVLGRLEVMSSARPLLIKALFVSLAGLVLGCAAYLSIRIFPLRALDRANEQLRIKTDEMERIRIENDQKRADAEMKRREDILHFANQLEHNLKDVVSAVSAAAQQTERVSRTVASSVNSANDQTQELTTSAQQAIANVQVVAQSAEELSISFAAIVERISNASLVASNATVIAQSTNTSVQQLSGAAQKIGEITKVISSIAAQTNLLALNATIEAARAGEAGRGFAVVAMEVKELSSQTAKATESIATQIAEMQTIATKAVSAVRAISQIVAEVDSASSTVAAVVGEQQRATSEITHSTHRAAIGTDGIMAKIEDVNRIVMGTSSAAQASLDATNVLRSQADVLTRSLDEFLVNLRAA
ncbi:MAG: hypothetical protein K2Y71_21330 [Xanthobacteraceae bacterium]|nr:hypothetical protein [Xanthobacteraceae bacterium]